MKISADLSTASVADNNIIKSAVALLMILLSATEADFVLSMRKALMRTRRSVDGRRRTNRRVTWYAKPCDYAY